MYCFYGKFGSQGTLKLVNLGIAQTDRFFLKLVFSRMMILLVPHDAPRSLSRLFHPVHPSILHRSVHTGMQI